MTVLIVTHSQDNESIPMAIDAIEEQGGKAFRLDTDKFPTEVQLDLHYGKETERLILTSSSGELNLQEVSAVWYRRIRIGECIPTTMDAQLRNASIRESQATVQGMIASLKAFHLDPLPAIRRAGNKQLQLQVAREIGLDTPRTLITNNPVAAKAFASQCQEGLIAKMLSSFAIYENGVEKVVFTNAVQPEDLDNLDSLSLCPMTFQEKIPKALELRTIVVGKQVFTASIDSQSSVDASVDWRREGITMIKDWQFYDLPEKVKEKILTLLNYFGLNYGALDLIVTPDGRHVFLEVNPVGEFFWLESHPGLPISKAIADVLLNPIRAKAM